MGTILVQSCKELARLAQKLGPYLLVEMVLPGGTLIALLLFLYQRRDVPMVAHLRALRRLAGQTIDALREPLAAAALAFRGAAGLVRSSHYRHDGLEPLSVAP